MVFLRDPLTERGYQMARLNAFTFCEVNQHTLLVGRVATCADQAFRRGARDIQSKENLWVSH